MNIYVANLHFSVIESELRQLFELYGAVASVNIIFDKKKQKSKGYAFVEMEKESHGQKAIAEIDQKQVRGRTLKVSLAN